MEALQIFNYNDAAITFNNEEGTVFVNATEMAKQFGKLPADFTRLKSTKNFLKELESVRQIPISQLVIVKKGNSAEIIEQGTWMHEDVALEFSRWLSPAFAIWCNDRIKELLRTGVATVSNDDDVIAQAMAVLQKRLEASAAEKRLLESKLDLTEEIVNHQTQQLQIAAPKVQYVDQVLQSANTYTATQMAKELEFRSVEQFNERLRQLKIQFKQGNQWLLTAGYAGRGYTKTKTHPYTKSDGTTGTNTQTVWTEKGREFLHSLAQQKATV